MKPCLNKFNMSDCNCSFNFGLNFAMWRFSRIFRLPWCLGADDIIFHTNLCSLWTRRCFEGSELSDGLSCSDQRICAFLFVSPMYVSPQEHIPSYMTVDLCRFLSLSGKSDRIFLVFHMIINLYLFCLVHSPTYS